MTFTCNVTQGFILEWILEPIIHSGDGIRLRAANHGVPMSCHEFTTVNCNDLDFVANLTHITNPMIVQGTRLFDMEATLTFTATTTLNGKVLQCRGSNAVGLINILNTTINFSGAFML